ncbi:hypothetical protein M405DRAFT_835586, partial [Rhizopogon salebrosus TDB-379]
MCTALHIYTVSNLVLMAATSSPNSRMLVDYHGAFSITHEMVRCPLQPVPILVPAAVLSHPLQ